MVKLTITTPDPLSTPSESLKSLPAPAPPLSAIVICVPLQALFSAVALAAIVVSTVTVQAAALGIGELLMASYSVSLKKY